MTIRVFTPAMLVVVAYPAAAVSPPSFDDAAALAVVGMATTDTPLSTEVVAPQGVDASITLLLTLGLLFLAVLWISHRARVRGR